MITLEFKLHETRLKRVALLLVQEEDKGVEGIGVFDKEFPEPNCFWVRVVATLEQLYEPTGLYKRFLALVIGLNGFTAFEKVCIKFDRRLPFGMVERLIPPLERYGFLRMLSFLASPAYSRARLYNDMNLEVWRDSTAIPAEYRVELTIWQGQFRRLIPRAEEFDAFSALLLFHKDPHDRQEIPHQPRFIQSEGRTEITPSTWLSPELFWGVFSRKTKTGDPENPYVIVVYVPGHKVVIMDGDGNVILPDGSIEGTDFYFPHRLAAMEGMQVYMFGEQLVFGIYIDGLWCNTFYLPIPVLMKPSEPYLGFGSAMKEQIRVEETAATPRPAAAA